MIRKLYRYTLAAAMGLLIAAGLSFTGAVPARAAPPAPPASCPNTSMCLYGNTWYATDQGYEIIPPSGRCEVLALRNQISSAWNNSGRAVRMYTNTSCTGSYWQMTNGTGDENFANNIGYSNTVDAIRFV